MTGRAHLRLHNFRAAVAGVREAVALVAERPLSELEKAGMVQRFEIAWELGWKLLADRLAAQLAPPETRTPVATIRAAFAAGMIDDGDDWIAAGKLRNTLSHTYDRQLRDDGLAAIGERFVAMFDRLLARAEEWSDAG